MQSLPANPKKDDDSPYQSLVRQAQGLLANTPRVAIPESSEEAEFLAAIAEEDQCSKSSLNS